MSRPAPPWKRYCPKFVGRLRAVNWVLPPPLVAWKSPANAFVSTSKALLPAPSLTARLAPAAVANVRRGTPSRVARRFVKSPFELVATAVASRTAASVPPPVVSVTPPVPAVRVRVSLPGPPTTAKPPDRLPPAVTALVPSPVLTDTTLVAPTRVTRSLAGPKFARTVPNRVAS